MNIALVIFKADPRLGGAERYTIDLAGSLARLGHAVTVLSTDTVTVPPGVRHCALPARALTRTGRYSAFLHSLDAHLASHPYDIVHAMLPVPRCDIYHPHAGLAAEALIAGHRRHASVWRRFLSAVGNRFNRKRQRFAEVERALLTGPNPPTVLCLSNYIKEEVRRHYSLDDVHLARLFNAVDLRKFDPESPDRGQALRERFDLSPDAVIALIVAQDFERKGVGAAIAALPSVDPRLILLIVGRDNPVPYQRLARRLGVDQRVVFAGATDDPVAFYQCADLFVLPTRHDPCSLVVLEALAMHLPVISTRYNGACEIMEHGAHGFILDDPDDPAPLAGALGTLVDRQQRWLTATAVRALRPQLSQERHLARLLAIYQERIKDRGWTD